MNPTTKLALTAGLVAAALEIPLAKRYPLATPVSAPVRLAFAGGLAFLGVVIAARLLGPQESR